MRLRVALLLVLLLASALPGPGREALEAPGRVRVEVPPAPDGTTTLVLRWDPVPGAFGYEVYEYRGGRWVLDEENPSRIPVTTSTRLAGLQPDTPYEFRVRAVGPDGQVSPMSEPVGGRTLAPGESAPAPPPAAPAPDPAEPPPPAPTGVIAVFGEDDTVQIAWRAVPGAVSYRVERQEEDGEWALIPGAAGRPSEPRTTVPGCPVPGPYRFRVRSVGADGQLSEPTWPVTVER